MIDVLFLLGALALTLLGAARLLLGLKGAGDEEL